MCNIYLIGNALAILYENKCYNPQKFTDKKRHYQGLFHAVLPTNTIEIATVMDAAFCTQ